MHVCLISGAYPPVRCGVGDYTECLAQGLAAAGLKVTVLTSVGSSSQSDPLVQVRAEISSWRLPGLFRLGSVLAKIQPEIVHLQYPSLGYGRGVAPNLFFAWLRCLRLPAKAIVTLHEYEMYSQLGRWRLLPTLMCTERIICTNQRDRDCIQQHEPWLADQLEVIPLGSSVGQMGSTKPAGLPRSGRTWLLHFGTVMPNKGWETLLPALQRLKQSGRDLGLRVAGELQPEQYAYHRKIQEMIQTLQLEGNVEFTGYFSKAQAEAILTSCPIAVQPYQEGLSLRRSSFIALLAYGRAIVTTDPLYTQEHVTHGQSFWGVIPHDPHALAEGIRHLLDHPELVARLQTRAKQAAEAFRWERIINLHRSLYQQAINR